jgi:hypothetical protein
MEGINNINKKISITIFTFLFLIRFIYSQYPTGIPPQNNAVSSLESNSIIQWIITSSTNGYSTVARYLANFISIKGIPIYVWSIITFLMATLFFVAIYIYLFEIFTQRTGISESETMKKAKILLIFALSVFSAIAIGFAIPFLFNLYGFILLILLLIALFFFGRAAISYGRSFHYAAKSFAANIEKDLLAVEKELKEARKDLSEQEVNYLKGGVKKAISIYNSAKKAFDNAEATFQSTLSSLENAYKEFINNLKNDYNNYLNNHKNNLQQNQIDQLEDFIKSLSNKKRKRSKGSNSSHTNNQSIPSIRNLYNDISDKIRNLNLDNKHKEDLKKILDNNYDNIQSQILSKIKATINEYEKARASLMEFYGFENGFKGNFEVRFRRFLGALGNREYEIGILSTLDKLNNETKNEIEGIEKLINERIQFLKSLLH